MIDDGNVGLTGFNRFWLLTRNFEFRVGRGNKPAFSGAMTFEFGIADVIPVELINLISRYRGSRAGVASIRRIWFCLTTTLAIGNDRLAGPFTTRP
jgi:hypothetical protein